MTRYDQDGPLDDQDTMAGDRAFVGVNMRLDAAQLPPGYVSEAINMRFRNGIAETRKGFTVLPWINKIVVTTVSITSITRVSQVATVTTATNHAYVSNQVVSISGAVEVEYNGNFIVTVTDATHFTYTVTGAPATPATGTKVATTSATQPWGTVYGVGRFSDPNTFQDYLIIAADGQVYYTQANNTPQQMTLPSGVTITTNVEFTQAFDVLLMHRGASESTLMLPRITSPWQLVDQTPNPDPEDGTEAIPNGTHSLFLQNRVLIPNDNDEIAVSDFNDYTRYVPILQELKINQGSSDALNAIAKFNDTTVIAFKQRHVYVINNFYGDLQALQQDELTDQFGCVARKSIAHVGKDLWFLSELGVMSVTQTEQNKLHGLVVPISMDIQPLIDRIAWRYASTAVGAFWDSKYYLAVPLDDAEVFGPELSPVSATFVGSNVILTTTVGRTYRYTKAAGDISLTNGTQTLTNSADFVAQGVTVLLNVVGIAQPPGSVREVSKGVNNAVLVYDFLNAAWSGYDTAEGFAFRDFTRYPYNGRDRLFAITNTGYLLLCEEDYEDQLPMPYADVTITVLTEDEDTIQVNGGTVVTLDYDLSSNTGTTCGAGSFDLATVQDNLWADFDVLGGYSPGTTSPWTAPNTLRVPTSTGVRFYGTNGRLPNIVLSANGQFSVTQVTTQAVAASVTTRGYATQDNGLSDANWATADLQTWNPRTTLTATTPGVNETTTVLDAETRDRTLYYRPSDATAFDVTNVNGDYLTPYRQDYSVLLGSATGAASQLYLHTTAAGVRMDLHQERRVTERLNARGRHAQLTISNDQGRVRLMSAMMELNGDTNKPGTEA